MNLVSTQQFLVGSHGITVCRIYTVAEHSTTNRACFLFWVSRLEAEEAFGLVLRRLRRLRGLSQEGLAFEAEMDRNYLSLLELGRNSASIKTIFKLAPALGVSVADFMAKVETEAKEKPASRSRPKKARPAEVTPKDSDSTAQPKRG